MSLAEIYTKLEQLQGGKELLADIKKEVTSLRNEAQTHREAKEKLEAELTSTQEKLTEAGALKQTELEKLQTQIKTITKKLEQAETLREEEKAKRVKADITYQVVDALTKGSAMDPQEFAKLIVPSIQAKDDGTYVFNKSDGTEQSIIDATNEWLQTHTWAIRDTQRAGSGAGNTAHGGGEVISTMA